MKVGNLLLPALSLTLLLLQLCVGCGTPNSTVGPNIILITVDTLRADHLGSYGYPRCTSPNVDRFARESLLFESCISHAPMTGSSTASILSGALPHETAVYGNRPLPKEVTTLPGILRKEGFRTMAVVSNYVFRAGRGWGKDFDIYDANMDQRERVRRKHPERNATNTTNRALKAVREHNGGAFFLWVHYQDPHGPYTPPQSFEKIFGTDSEPEHPLEINDSTSGIGGIPDYQALSEERDFHYYVSQYDAEIRYFDTELGRFIDGLKEVNVYQNSLIVFTADHGEGMGEHDYFFAHGENLYGSLTHVPLILKTENNDMGLRNGTFQHLDIVPTVRSVIGTGRQHPSRGRSLLGLMDDSIEVCSEMKRYLPRETALSEDELEKLKALGYVEGPAPSTGDLGGKYSLLHGGIKVIYTPWQNEWEIYDLFADPGEVTNLSETSKFMEGRDRLLARMDWIQDRSLPRQQNP